MLHLTSQIRVTVADQQKYGFEPVKSYDVVGTAIQEITSRETGEKKKVDCFLVVNDEKQVRTVFVSNCRVQSVL